MSVLLCKICGFKTFEAYALKRDGKLICPQCSTFYHSADEPSKPAPQAKFKFKAQPKGTIA
ncbi:MAG: hypothetical protein WC333_10665 [Dehalococcoidia bacterium]|jgi:uncharacterized Zn finger protein (UPF0148 family)